LFSLSLIGVIFIQFYVLYVLRRIERRIMKKEVEDTWKVESIISDVVSLKSYVQSLEKDFCNVHQDLSDLRTSLTHNNDSLKTLADGLIPVLGADSISLTESIEIVEKTSVRILDMKDDIEKSAARLIELRSVLLSLSEQFTIGDAESLQRVLLTFVKSVKREKRTEHLHRSAASFVKALQPFTEQEIIDRVKNQTPTDS